MKLSIRLLITILPRERGPNDAHSLQRKKDSVSLQYFFSGHSDDAYAQDNGTGKFQIVRLTNAVIGR